MSARTSERSHVPGIATAVGRWAKFGPYYAMFPVDFAFNAVSAHTSLADVVIDPFCGRGTAVYAAAASQRRGFGVEINPVGWIYGKTKVSPACGTDVIRRLHDIGTLSRSATARGLPEFFGWAFSPRVLRFLTTARRELNWRRSRVDRTLMAIILVYLHGKSESALSNQMRQTKSMSPEYSVNWWRDRNMLPPDHDPVMFLNSRIKWRYKYGTPDLGASTVLLGDSTSVIPTRVRLGEPRWKLLLTSPPYSGVTNYWYDQWLRLWMLGEPPAANTGDAKTGRFCDAVRYRKMLEVVFFAAAENAARGAIVYVRTDARERSAVVTEEVLRAAFPRKRMRRIARPFAGRTQTDLFSAAKSPLGEVDYILT